MLQRLNDCRRFALGCAMPSPLHEVVIDMFTERPDLVAPLLSALGCDLPDYETVEPRSERAAVVAPTEYYADAVLAFSVGVKPRWR